MRLEIKKVKNMFRLYKDGSCPYKYQTVTTKIVTISIRKIIYTKSLQKKFL